jgi:hypothetical protein
MPSKTVKKQYQVCEELLQQNQSLQKEPLTVKHRKQIMKSCKLGYYNDKKCSGTIFEPGNDKTVIDNVMKSRKMKPDSFAYNFTKALLISMRKNITRNKNYLQDGFYSKLSKKDVAQLKSKGATSGCAIINPLNQKRVNSFVKKNTAKKPTKR